MPASLFNFNKQDEFFLTDLDNGRWFGGNFDEFVLFGYIGDRERLEAAIRDRSVVRKVFELILPKLKISSVLKLVTGYDLGKVASDSGLAKQLFDLLAQEENKRTLSEQLFSIYTRGKKSGRYFTRIARSELNQTTLFEAQPAHIEDYLISACGHLVHRDTVAQHSKAFSATLRASDAQWILTDFPPHGLNERNRRFNGKAVLLREDKGFSKAFGAFLPFNSTIGWYPYVRVTGFYSSGRISTEKLPSMSISLVEYRPPKPYLEVRQTLLSFAKSELTGTLNYLDDWSDFLLFSYLAPIIFSGSNLDAKDVDTEFGALLRTYTTKVAADLPTNLVKFYQSIPAERDA